MNHIELYEKTIIDNSYHTLDLRLLMKQFNNMRLEEANDIILKLKEFIDLNTNAYMTMETTLKLSDKMVEIPLK